VDTDTPLSYPATQLLDGSARPCQLCRVFALPPPPLAGSLKPYPAQSKVQTRVACAITDAAQLIVECEKFPPNADGLRN